MQKPIILFKDFTFQYHAQAEPSLYDINLAIYPGEKILIAGPSGSGKSTLANCINGLIPFNYRGSITGHVEVNSVETSKQNVFELSKIVGTVLQDTDGQFVGLTTGEDIAFSLENNCVPKDEMLPLVKSAANLTGMGDAFLDASPFDLSGGQKQRVSMSGVLVEDVQILLFDEPLASLDPATGKLAVELIDKIKKDTDTTVVIIEHRIEDVLFRAVDRVIVMQDGRIVADSPTDELLSTDFLRDTGLREPLYVAAMKYAGVKITPAHHSSQIDTLRLQEGDKSSINQWYNESAKTTKQSSETELIRIQDLSFTYEARDTPALSGVNFTIDEGEMTAIVGTNGAGKSTLAKLICGFETPSSGSISLRKKDITENSIASRAEHIGYVMQNPNQMICKPFISEEVGLGLFNRGVSENEINERVEATLEICGLRQFRKWPISALSYGQKKRVTIASVLILEPDIIILDEPTAGQDYRHYTEIMEFLRTLQKRGITVLLITHDMHLMLEYAPRALVFSEGKLLADMSSSELLCNPELSEKASLKETSLFHLAEKCNIADPAAFTKCFVDFEERTRNNA
ncbi:MAG: ABC transporter ATP-binding protein [Oscillospiraceae bacterium]|nr:ABC transporter ATP-binding protein [Oscillospiraceae bacterium]